MNIQTTKKNSLANLFGQTLIPNRRPAELRPLVEDPPAFFLAPRIPPNRRSSHIISVPVVFIFILCDGMKDVAAAQILLAAHEYMPVLLPMHTSRRIKFRIEIKLFILSIYVYIYIYIYIIY